jgi:serine protease Do
MRKAIAGGLLAVALLITAIILTPSLSAQAPRRAVIPAAPLFMAPGGQLGVSVRELRADEIQGGQPETGGVFVEEVRPDGAGAKAGLKSGDIITEFDGERVRGVRHFLRLVTETPADRPVKATIIRGRDRQTISVTPDASGGDRLARALPEISRNIERELRGLPDLDFDLQLPRPDIFDPRGRFGVTLAPLTDQLASYFGVKEGVLVSAVEAESPAAQAGLKAGDVITSIGGHSVNDPSDVSARVRQAAPGMPLDVRVVREKKEVTLKATIPERRQLARDRGLPI